MKEFFNPTKCHKCGTENPAHKVDAKNIPQNEIDILFYLETYYYRCWYCGEKWVNVELKKK